VQALDIGFVDKKWMDAFGEQTFQVHAATTAIGHRGVR
jgi:hypothetical protein